MNVVSKIQPILNIKLSRREEKNINTYADVVLYEYKEKLRDVRNSNHGYCFFYLSLFIHLYET